MHGTMSLKFIEYQNFVPEISCNIISNEEVRFNEITGGQMGNALH